MRNLFSYLIIFSLSFSPLAFGQINSKNQSVRLQDYFINPTVDLDWMTERERAAYVAYLYSLRMLIETELSADMVISFDSPEVKPKSTSKFEILFHLLSPLFKIDQAAAIVPAVIGAVAVIRVAGPLIVKAYSRMGSQTAKIAIEKAGPRLAGSKVPLKDRAKDVTDVNFRDVPNGTKGSSKGAAEYAAVVAVSAYSTAQIAILADDEAPKKPQDAKLAQAETAIDISDAVSRKLATKQNEPRDLEALVNREGLFCFFGGHASTYVKRGNKFVCPAPAGTVNNPVCKGQPAPSFYCQDMGLSESIKRDDVSKKLCVSLISGRGLLDLTVRCKDAFINEFLPSVQTVNPAEIKKLQDEISAGITALEKKKGIEDIGFLEYCSNDGSNKVNSGRQTKPCQAVLQMVKEIQNYPAIAKGADPAAASQESPAGNPPKPARSTK